MNTAKEATWLVDGLGGQIRMMRPDHDPKPKPKPSMKHQELVAPKANEETRKCFVLIF